MKRDVIWSPVAEKDLFDVLEYLSNNWPENIKQTFFNRIEYSIELIAHNPNIFPTINRAKKIKKCVLSSQNTLYYRFSLRKIEIIRIFDSRQNPEKLKL
jgi:plasmid stabilization system protein ParE